MKIIWSKTLEDLKSVCTYFEGTFRKNGGVLTIYHWGWSDEFSELELSDENGEVISIKRESREKQKELKKLYDYRTEPSREAYVKSFGEYTVINDVGQWGYNCYKNGEHIWKKSLWAYLYTEIERHGDTLVLGTAGQGGHFYGLDIETGEVRFDFNTKGTARYFVYGEDFVFLSHEKNGRTRILRISQSGEVLDSMEIPGYSSEYDRPTEIIGDKFYILTLKVKKDKEGNEWRTPAVYCISL
jgi:hypothetical protein